MSAWIERAKRVFRIEIDALKQTAEGLNQAFEKACALLLSCRGRVVVMGMGKSGHVARKIAATLASTGTPAFFVHPGEAGHGDAGMITHEDVVLALSHSGTTQEILTLVPCLKRLGVPLILLTGEPEAELARAATVVLFTHVREEACPLNLAPTASTTAALALGDALAVSLLEERGFTAEHFARIHPSGRLGQRLLLHISDVMRRPPLPVVFEDSTLRDALMVVSEHGLGIAAVLNKQQQLVGVFTDGDLRRTLDHHHSIHDTLIADVMSRPGVRMPPDMLAAEALHTMQHARITAVMVVDDQQTLLGICHIHQLLQAGV